MLKLSDFAGRLLRTDSPDTLGIPTQNLIEEAIDKGNYEEAKNLNRTTLNEFKAQHDLY